MTEQCSESINGVDKREWVGCIAIARELLETLGIKTHAGIDAMEEGILFRLGKDFKDAALMQGKTFIKNGA